jgi:predicted alpha/beta-hydrolase family hydrolase
MPDFLEVGPVDAKTILLLAPGAGAPVTSPWMEQVAGLLADAGHRVLLFDFVYMMQGKPPQKAERLMPEYEAAIEKARAGLAGGRQLIIGGKSLGGRVASLVAERAFASEHIAGLVCLSYPFHPPKKPEQLRTQHLAGLTCPTLIVQGERDPFGVPSEVATYNLSSAICVHWCTDGDHDLKPRKSSGATLGGNLAGAVQEVTAFARSLD